MSNVPQEKDKINKIDNSNNIKSKETNSIEPIKDINKISNVYHPLEFYALGKNKKNTYKNISTFCDMTPMPPPILKPNRSSHELFDRNLLSINNSLFDNSKKVKNIVSLDKLNRNENNYLDPLLSIHNRNEDNKENQKKNNINSLEWLNLIKSKLFTIDINSEIKRGKNISRNIFYELKDKMVISPNLMKGNKSFDNNNNNNINNNDNKTIQSENKNATNNTTTNTINNKSEGLDYNYNNNKSVEKIFGCKRFKKDNEKLNKINIIKPEKYSDYWKKIKLGKSYSTEDITNKKHEIKLLKPNALYFDKTTKNILRHKNWWIINQ